MFDKQKLKKCTIILSIIFIIFTQSQNVIAQVSSDTTATDSTNISITDSSETVQNSSVVSVEDETTAQDETTVQEESSAQGDSSNATDGSTDDNKKVTYDDSESSVPAAKRPKTPDPEKVAAAVVFDTDDNTEEDKEDTLKYGIETDITALIDDLIKNEDPRFSDIIYDLFQTTRSSAVREKIIQYFIALKDPCIEDYCVTILNDPFDTKNSTVSLCFKYISTVKCKAAINAVINLLEGENTEYFSGAITTLGEIGGTKEAVYLSQYLDRDSLTVPQRQQLMRVLGKLKAVKTWKKLSTIVKNEDENTFVRMYAAEAIGEMKKKESIPILSDLFENSNPNIRQYAIKGLSYFSDQKAENVIIQGIKDKYYKVRIESIKAAAKQNIQEAVPYIIYRVNKDPENVVKKECYTALASLNTEKGNEYLVSLLTDKKVSDSKKSLAAKALMKDNTSGEQEILTLAKECLKDDKRKDLRYALGKLFVEYGRPAYSEICKMYLSSKDVSTVGIGLDLYGKGKYDSCKDTVQSIASDDKAGVNKNKAERILSIK